GQGEMASFAKPIERRRDPFTRQPVPSVAEPKSRRSVAAVGHEFLPFVIGNEPAGNLVRMKQRLVPRPLAIERKAVIVSPNLDQPGPAVDPAQFLVRGGVG